METVQQNGRFTLFSIKLLSIYSILYGCHAIVQICKYFAIRKPEIREDIEI